MIKPVIHDVINRKVCSFDFETPLLKNLKAGAKLYDYNTHLFITEIKNKENKTLAKEVFSMYENNPNIIGLEIDVNKKYRSQHHLGEVLRLISIIEMIENKIRNLKIFSKDTAVYFHAKYKFIPSIVQFIERDVALEDIIKNDSPLTKEYTSLAKNLLSKIKSAATPEEQRELSQEANVTINNYIKTVLLEGNKKYKQYPFSRGMNMTLTMKEIINNKDFFNSLFAKHNIDYQI